MAIGPVLGLHPKGRSSDQIGAALEPVLAISDISATCMAPLTGTCSGAELVPGHIPWLCHRGRERAFRQTGAA